MSEKQTKVFTRPRFFHLFSSLYLILIWICWMPRGRAQDEPSATLTYRLSWHAGDKDVNGKMMYGTEVMRILPYKGKLYASNSLWTETDRTIPKACQLLVLEAPDAKWKLLHQFTAQNLRLVSLQNVTFTTDGAGKSIQPMELLLTAPDQVRPGPVEVYSLDDNTNKLVAMRLGATEETYSSIRAIGFHHDAVTGVDYVFAGSTSLGLYRGVYDTDAPGHIRWQASEYSLPAGVSAQERERVMGFATCNGVLYAATSKHILKRKDGAAPSWTLVKDYPNESVPVGVRGLSAVPNPAGDGEVLLFVARGPAGHSLIRRISPDNDYAEKIELDINAAMSRQLDAKIAFTLAAYNDFLPYTLPGTGEKVWLWGIEATYAPAEVPKHPEWRVNKVEKKHLDGAVVDSFFAAEGRYFIRHVKNGVVTEELKEITDPALPTLISVRTVAASPFPAEQGKVLYFGGYDCNFQPSHNTAWIYRCEFQELKENVGKKQ